MTAITSGDRRRIGAIPPGGQSRVWRWVVLAGILGGMAELLTYLAVRTRLPASIPTHYGLSGQVTASMSPAGFLGVALALQLGTTLVLAGLAYAALRSGLIEQQQGGGIARILGATLAVVLAVALPAPIVDLLAGDGGYLPPGFGAVPPGLATVLFLAPVAVVPIVLIAAMMASRRRSPSGERRDMQFECSSCGETFAPTTWRWVLGPHLGASVYLRCPRCGERGWDRRVGSPVWGSAANRSDPGKLG